MTTKTPKLNLTYILDHDCGNAEDFDDWTKWHDGENEKRRLCDEDPHRTFDYTSYPGWMRYNISVHCIQFVVIARKLPNGGYHVREFLAMNH